MANEKKAGDPIDKSGGSPKNNVSISVDGDSMEVRRGSWEVSKLKEEIGVDADYELDIVEDGTLTELEDDGRLVIKGGEVFVSHVRTGAAA